MKKGVKATLLSERGVSLIEILIAIVLIAIISIATLSYFAHGLGGVGKSGNQRAALERARERLEELLAANLSEIKPAVDGVHWLTCAGSPCAWGLTTTATTQPVVVDDLTTQMETTVEWKDDPEAGTVSTHDTLELSVKVWFRQGQTNNSFNRVHIRTLRTP